ncbi:hypothetical protein BCR44DRAFT_1501669 [Catenaria anguillulae PL171]|uniref:Cache domain-containing protein n=1 Tax=Catenaria anguillulae PL171 TaxID=765915 RepID=A0A1Y2HE05_9FUNG|nr:hypothetical protein BCR44DRAFT_1501669 [Catenaria anguillulae PL171]
MQFIISHHGSQPRRPQWGQSLTASSPPIATPSPPSAAPVLASPPSRSRSRPSFLGRRPSLAPILNRLNLRPPAGLQHERLSTTVPVSASAESGTLGDPALKRPKVLIPFGAILSGFMLVLAGLVAPLSWYFTNSAGVSTSFQFANQLQTALLDHAVSSIVIHVDAAERLTGLQQRNWRSGNFQLSNKTLVMRQLFDRLKYNQDLIVTQSFTTYLGELWGYYTYDIDAQDRILKVAATNSNYNATNDSWVTIVNRTDVNSVAWTPVYVWQNVAWLTQSRPIFNPSGAYIGVASSDLELTFLRGLLEARVKAVTRPTSMYAFEANSEYIIGTSVSSLDMFVRQGTQRVAVAPKTMKQVGDTDPLVRKIHEKLLLERGRKLTELGNATETITSVASSNNATASGGSANWIVSTQTIQWNSIHWVILQVMNEEEVMREINVGSYQAAGAVAGLLVGCILVAVFFSLAFSKSLDKVTRYLNKITDSDFMALDPTDFDLSPMSANPSGSNGGVGGRGASGVAVHELSLCLDIRRIQEAFAGMVRSFVRAAHERSTTVAAVGGASSPRNSATIHATSALENDE